MERLTGTRWIVLLQGLKDGTGPWVWGAVRLPGTPRKRGGPATGRTVPGWVKLHGAGTVPPAAKRYDSEKGARAGARGRYADVRKENATCLAIARVAADGRVIQTYPINLPGVPS